MSFMEDFYPYPMGKWSPLFGFEALNPAGMIWSRKYDASPFQHGREWLTLNTDETDLLYWESTDNEILISHPWICPSSDSDSDWVIVDRNLKVLTASANGLQLIHEVHLEMILQKGKSLQFDTPSTRALAELFQNNNSSSNKFLSNWGTPILHVCTPLRKGSGEILGWQWRFYHLHNAPSELIWRAIQNTIETKGSEPSAFFDIQKRMLWRNNAFDLFEKSLSDPNTLDVKEQFTTLLDQSCQGIDAKVDLCIRDDESIDIWYSFNFLCIKDSEGNPLGVFTDAHEISHLKEAQESIRKAHQETERLHQAKTNFISIISHEIRTPLTAVVSLTEVLAQSAQSLEQIEQTLLLKEAAELMMRQINAVLDYSRLERGKIELHPEVVHLQALLERMVRLFKGQAISKGLTMEFQFDSNIPEFIILDGNALEQILTNLLGNALKFTANGNIILGTKIITQDEKQIVLDIHVSDTGQGIDSKIRNQIFGLFFQGDASWKRKHAGIGLGLAIASKLATLMNGSIQYEENTPQGSIFHLQLVAEKLV